MTFTCALNTLPTTLAASASILTSPRAVDFLEAFQADPVNGQLIVPILAGDASTATQDRFHAEPFAVENFAAVHATVTTLIAALQKLCAGQQRCRLIFDEVYPGVAPHIFSIPASPGAWEARLYQDHGTHAESYWLDFLRSGRKVSITLQYSGQRYFDTDKIMLFGDISSASIEVDVSFAQPGMRAAQNSRMHYSDSKSSSAYLLLFQGSHLDSLRQFLGMDLSQALPELSAELVEHLDYDQYEDSDDGNRSFFYDHYSSIVTPDQRVTVSWNTDDELEEPDAYGRVQTEELGVQIAAGSDAASALRDTERQLWDWVHHQKEPNQEFLEFQAQCQRIKTLLFASGVFPPDHALISDLSAPSHPVWHLDAENMGHVLGDILSRIYRSLEGFESAAAVALYCQLLQDPKLGLSDAESIEYVIEHLLNNPQAESPPLFAKEAARFRILRALVPHLVRNNATYGLLDMLSDLTYSALLKTTWFQDHKAAQLKPLEAYPLNPTRSEAWRLLMAEMDPAELLTEVLAIWTEISEEILLYRTVDETERARLNEKYEAMKTWLTLCLTGQGGES